MSVKNGTEFNSSAHFVFGSLLREIYKGAGEGVMVPEYAKIGPAEHCPYLTVHCTCGRAQIGKEQHKKWALSTMEKARRLL